ncbi:PEP-CTERM sorting domain-containing protein [Pseudoduganella namucuonensis]|uniref:PEP-CTERM protein-sorting domain-containing protein n=1 Tax=Pseudoduganella namucuonensis TaxID=1035707 RepID=A0A1I7HDB0_9BURK|nr:PEP-CTERM sorting domain-containing protein [Pseudoduganella namucuonensis]SFU58602.1 PEP-CTERM protein-sorting domain-containing protein [Pseudoduganella namucuonensis]
MQTTKKAYLLTALAASLGFAAVPAQAATFASSILNITNFRLLHANGTAYSVGDFSTLAGNNNAHATAELNNVFDNGADTRSITAAVAPNVAHQCVGACFPLAEDNFAPIAGLPPVTTTYGYADQRLTGAAIRVGATPAGANASTRADASTSVNAVAAGNSDVGTSTTFAFTMGAADDTMTVSFTGNPYTRALVTPGAGAVSDANARLSWSLNIINMTTHASVLNYAPDALNSLSAVSATHAAPDNVVYAPGATLFSAVSGLLKANQTYQITIQHNSFANATQNVPEPATLTVMAAGLMGIALVRRRRAG